MRIGWIVLVAGLFAGCAAPHARVHPVPVPPSGERFDAVVAELLARPVRPPTIASGSSCPVDDSRPLGASPLYPTQLHLQIRPHNERGSDGLFDLKNLWLSSAGAPGPVVVRVARLDAAGRGLVRLYYNDAMSRNDAVVFPVPDLDEDWPSGTFVPGPGCYAYLLEGASFSMSIVFSVEREAA